MAAINSSRSYFEVSGTSANLASGGTVASSGATLTGTSTSFQDDLDLGDVIHEAGTTDFLIVTGLASQTSATVHQAPSTAMSGATVNKYPFTQVQAAFDATGPSPEAESIDVTTWDTSGFTEKIAGLIDAGTFDVTMYFQPRAVAAHRNLLADFYAGTRRAWRIWMYDSASATVPPDTSNSRFTFVGDIGGMPVSISQGSAVEASLSILITGEAVLTYGGQT